MANTAEFYFGSDWECSSGPMLPYSFDASVDIWPHGLTGAVSGGAKDVLADGLHPVLAIGPRAARPRNVTGVVINYDSATDRAVLNLADKVVVKAYVANVLTYAATVPATWATSLDIMEPVYVDDSDSLAAGVTLSLSPLNQIDEANPLAGYLFYAQNEYDDSGIGGATAYRSWPITVAGSTVYTLVCVMLVNDFGIGNTDPTP